MRKISHRRMGTTCRVSALLLVLVMVFSLSGCMGKSAYQAAKDKGFEGTEQEWVDSLAGRDGSTWLTGEGAPAAADGAEGDLYLDTVSSDVWKKQSGAWTLLCNVKGMPGEAGTQGKSAYEAYCEQYGYAGTEQEWLAKVHEKLSEKSAQEIYQLAKDATVAIECYDADGNQTGGGSGFFINEDGVLVTAYHVIKGAQQVKVRLGERTSVNVTSVVGFDIARDLVLLKLAAVAGKVSHLEVETQGVMPGESVYSFGSPLGFLDGSFSAGVVAAEMRTQEAKNGDEVQYVQFTASISPGNSGGPLLNSRGKVVGIVDSHYAYGNDLNLAVYINELKNVKYNYNKSIANFYKETEYYTVKFADNLVYEGEKNDTLQTPNALSSGDTVGGVTTTADHDYFKLVLTSDSYLTLAYACMTQTATSEGSQYFYYPALLKASGVQVGLDWSYATDEDTTLVYASVMLPAGTYLIDVRGYYAAYDTYYTLYTHWSTKVRYENFPYSIGKTDFMY